MSNLTGTQIKDQYLEAEKKKKNKTSALTSDSGSQYYQNMYDTLDKERENALKNQYIRAEKLQKYVPKVMQASGYGGSGLSESALISAYNDNNAQINSIESDFADKKNEILKQYADYQNKQKQYQDEQAWKERDYQNKQKQYNYEKQVDLYKEIIDGINSGVITSEDSLSGLPAEYQNIAKSYINAYGKENAASNLQSMLDTFYDATIDDKDKPDSQDIIDYADKDEYAKSILEDPAYSGLKSKIEQLRTDNEKAKAISDVQETVPDYDGGKIISIDENLTAESFGNDANKLKELDRIIADAKDGDLDGKYVNVNTFGAPTDYYYVKDKKFYHTGDSNVTDNNYWGWEKYSDLYDKYYVSEVKRDRLRSDLWAGNITDEEFNRQMAEIENKYF